MLERKTDRILREWKSQPGHRPLIIRGCPRCGKTFSVQKFARENYARIISLSCRENPDLAAALAGRTDPDAILLRLSALLPPPVNFVPGNTLLIFREIQECPGAWAALRLLSQDGRFDVIGTSSFPEAGDVLQSSAADPDSRETVRIMHPLDFEEFLLAQGIGDQHIALLADALKSENPVPEALHCRMSELLLLYAVTGGMPEAVECLLETHNLRLVREIQQDIVNSFLDSPLRQTGAFTATSSSAFRSRPLVRECLQSIPDHLSRENRKFQYARIRKGGTAAQFAASLQWLEEAGIIVRCHNLARLELPLEDSVLPESFKIYMQDTGLFVSMLDDRLPAAILQGSLAGNNGAVAEALAADILNKLDLRLCYYRRKSGLTVDLVLPYQGECLLIEIRKTTGNAKALRMVLARQDGHPVAGAFKFGDWNISRQGRILRLPWYMMFLLKPSGDGD